MMLHYKTKIITISIVFDYAYADSYKKIVTYHQFEGATIFFLLKTIDKKEENYGEVNIT